MSPRDPDDPGSPPGSEPDRPRRRGSSARREVERQGFWRRVVGWVASPDQDPDQGQTPTGPQKEQDTVRLEVQLILPDGQRLVVAARPVQEPAYGLLELELEPPPVNSQDLVDALYAAVAVVSGVGAGTDSLQPDISVLQFTKEEVEEEVSEVQARGDDDSLLDVPIDVEDLDGPAEPPLAPARLSVPGEAEPGPAPAPPQEEPAGPPLVVLVSSRDGPKDELEALHAAGEVSPVSSGEFDAQSPTVRERWLSVDELGGSAQEAVPEVETKPPAQAQDPPRRPRKVSPHIETRRVSRGSAVPRPDSQVAPIVGIDFGTTYSSVAVFCDGLKVIPDEAGEVQMPSVVSFPKPGMVLLGEEARKRMAGEAQWTIASPKRLLGRAFSDSQVAQVIGGLAFRTFAGSDRFTRFEAHGEIYSVTDICAMILHTLRERASQQLGAEVTKAVFTVPVSFGSLQRSALKLAARQAGLEVVGMLTEPSASALSHGFYKQNITVAIYDFGGGTFDFCVLRVRDTAYQVLCAGGDAWLGGDDFDGAMANFLADQFWQETGVDLRSRAVEWQALLFACERAKRELSSHLAAEIRLENLLFTAEGRKGLHHKISRQEFSTLTQHLVEKSVTTTDKVMQQAGLSASDVDAVILSGGTSQIPSVREVVTQYFGTRPLTGDPELAVVKGAALRAAELSGEAIGETAMAGRTLREVAGRTYGVGLKDGPVTTLIERDTQLPAEANCVFFTEHDGQTEMVVNLYEESKARIDESRTIGKLRYKGLKPAPAGERKIEFSFLLDEDGMLHVTANVEGREYSKTIKL